VLVDLNDEIAKPTALKIVYKLTTISGGLSLVTAGQFDMMLADLTMSEKRKRSVAFTTPFYVDANGIVVQVNSSLITVDSLNGRVCTARWCSTPSPHGLSAGRVDSSQTAALVTNALSMAIANRDPQGGGIIHSDHGVQHLAFVGTMLSDVVDPQTIWRRLGLTAPVLGRSPASWAVLPRRSRGSFAATLPLVAANSNTAPWLPSGKPNSLPCARRRRSWLSAPAARVRAGKALRSDQPARRHTGDGPAAGTWTGRNKPHRGDRQWVRARSPEQIAERLKLDFPDDESMRISHEAIYQALYVEGRGALKRELILCLRTGRALRAPQARARSQTWAHVTPEALISERPAEVEDRAVPGHWEGDLLIGLERSAIGTLVERKPDSRCWFTCLASRATVTVRASRTGPRWPATGR
jgi:Bacterial extracellular solute-binding proteins, family 3